MTETPGDFEIPEEAVVAGANAALAAGFIDPDDGTIPQWISDANPIPVWTHPSELVKVILRAALPHLRVHQTKAENLNEPPAVQVDRDALERLIRRGYDAILCNGDIPGWTIQEEVSKVAAEILTLLPTETETNSQKALAETATELGRTLGRAEALDEVETAIRAKLGITSRALPIISQILARDITKGDS